MDLEAFNNFKQFLEGFRHL